MALISEFEESSSEIQRKHSSVQCGWRYFDVHGERFLQLDTYGSEDRKLKGKQSQSIQLDRDAAAELLRILQTAFPGLGR